MGLKDCRTRGPRMPDQGLIEAVPMSILRRMGYGEMLDSR